MGLEPFTSFHLSLGESFSPNGREGGGGSARTSRNVLKFTTIDIKLTGQVMPRKIQDAIKEYLSQIASKGGKARAAKYDKATLSKWAKRGGRPSKDAGSNRGKNK
jgi:hypothetical protein